jgi:uncharacterized protein (TIGR00266 family)
MDVDIQCAPAYAVAYCILSAGESVLVERGAMIAMSGNINATAGISGSVGRALMRKAVGGESFFMGRYTAAVAGSWVAVASGRPGDIARISLGPTCRAVLVESGGLLAAGPGVDVDVRWAGVRNIMLREGAVLLRAQGDGDLLVGAFGGIQRFDLGPADTIIIDTGHVVGFTEGMALRVGPLTGVVTAGVTGEGLVGQFTGPGTVWLQTRSDGAFRSWLWPERGQ